MATAYRRNDGKRRAPLVVVTYFLKELMAAMFRSHVNVRVDQDGDRGLAPPDWAALRSIVKGVHVKVIFKDRDRELASPIVE
jgi:hypothetical protein